MSISEVNKGARCEVCGSEATWEAGNPGQAAKGPRYRQRFLCGPDSAAWGKFFDPYRDYVRSGTRINFLRWQEVFDRFVKEAREKKLQRAADAYGEGVEAATRGAAR